MYETIEQIKQANEFNNGRFFSPENMRFSGSRILSRIVAGRFFVTSELDYTRTMRSYTIREAKPDGRIVTPITGERYADSASAYRAAEQLAKEQAEEQAKEDDALLSALNK
jgi:hypothetical protein